MSVETRGLGTSIGRSPRVSVASRSASSLGLERGPIKGFSISPNGTLSEKGGLMKTPSFTKTFHERASLKATRPLEAVKTFSSDRQLPTGELKSTKSLYQRPPETKFHPSYLHLKPYVVSQPQNERAVPKSQLRQPYQSLYERKLRPDIRINIPVKTNTKVALQKRHLGTETKLQFPVQPIKKEYRDTAFIRSFHEHAQKRGERKIVIRGKNQPIDRIPPLPTTVHELRRSREVTQRTLPKAALEQRVRVLQQAYEKQYRRKLPTLPSGYRNPKLDQILISSSLRTQKVEKTLKQAAAVIEERQTATQQISLVKTQEQMLSLVHQAVQEVQNQNTSAQFTQARSTEMEVKITPENQQRVQTRKLQSQKVRIDSQLDLVKEKEEYVPERDYTVDSNRIQKAVEVGTQALHRAKQEGKQTISSSTVAVNLPEKPSGGLVSLLRHQLQLPLNTEKQYDEFRSELVATTLQLSSQSEIKEAAHYATNKAPAVRLNKRVTTEPVSEEDVKNVIKDGNEVILYSWTSVR